MCTKTSGLAQNSKSVDALDAYLQRKSPDLPDAEMIDAEPPSVIIHCPETTESSEQSPKPASANKEKEEIRE
ncbi:hypothetical protein K3495_g4856 [Podosphaera aphanis]|nr:hypothetical protein K3495_g4856 [Podosphaera aphanis]